MPQVPIDDEVATAFGRFFGGAGPSHSQLSEVFTACGYHDDDPY